MSDTHKSLAEALVAFQAEAPTLTKDATNPHFRSKFVSLDTIVETVRPLLAKHGLAWSALPCFGPNGEPALRYTLRHAGSEEVLTDTMPLLLAKSDPQGQGSALTYARRYSISAVLNLVADEDDDGNAATDGRRRAQAAQSLPAATTVSRADAESLAAMIQETGWTKSEAQLQLAAAGAQDTTNVKAAIQSLTGFQAEALRGAMNAAIDSRAVTGD